jgi:ectoine hydroxylase-related dioxygenase (phytanoyl-CoA dioxygenase family)
MHEIAVTPETIAAYQRDGAVLVKGLLAPGEIALLEAGLEEIRADAGELYSLVQSDDGRGETLAAQYPSLRSPSTLRLLREGPGARLAARLMGVSSAQLVLDQVFYKQAGPIVPTPWHQDTPFLQVRGNQMARVWLSCDSSPAELSVQVVRGSHRWNVVFDTATMAESKVRTAGEGEAFTYDGMAAPGQPAVPDIEAHRGSFDIMRFDVKPGDAVVFNGNMLHGAQGCDHHPLPRRALAVMWGGPDLRYHRPAGHAMPLPGGSDAAEIPHGARIGDHPEAFPLFWRE